ncbi:MAG: GMC oxidoreductase [Gemmatimonadaceae bacterium]|nr:GMC oxidoreductase [Gemmatimonadaceae bacterium]
MADRLAESWDITIVELGSQATPLQQRVLDTATPAVTYPHIGSGLGGTTALWHNGLIEVDEDIFQEKWPFCKSELAPYYTQAYPKLAGAPQSAVMAAVETLREKYLAIGFPEKKLGQGLFFPRQRVNTWHSLKLKGRVKVVEGEVTALLYDGKREVRHLLVKSADGEHKVSGDVFILAAGGLGTPLLLQKLAEHFPLPALQQAGLHYEDHPSAFVGEITLDAPLYNLWNYPAPHTDGNLRLPLVVKQDGLQVSFQLRPAAIYHRTPHPRVRVRSVLTELRNEPFNPRPYFRLLTHWDDILDILSFRFRIHLPTQHYSLLMVAEQPPATTRNVWGDKESPNIYRKWDMPATYILSLQKSIHQALNILGNMVTNANVFPCWPSNIFSSSHHSGTARMAASPDQGVCDKNGRVHGLENLYVCDGSLIPASGYANTGLTIAALALRMADHLRRPH